MEHPEQWQSYLPFIIIALVLAIRLRRINRERRMHLGRLLVAPTIIVVVAGYLAATATPDLTGVGIAAGAMVIGGIVGWQRARFMTIAYDPAVDVFTMKQSPAAVLFLIAIMLVRRVVMAEMPVSHIGAGVSMARAMWPIDGLIGFGLAMVIAHNTELYLRARRMKAALVQ
ncbi:hypothetical protein [Novosphingobium sp.]|uniref:hypothetical protein n=1 Tax=Novosphingobium sp. TaxID=1874826 RepID=UPI003D131B4A